jgi:hypothetical protein
MLNITFRKNLFRLNAGFLVLMGGVFGVLDYIGFRTGIGPLGDLLQGNFLAVGMQEAHGLAFLMGLLLFTQAVRTMDASWHLVGAGVHVLLGVSNLIFWGHFQGLGILNPEIVVTAIHWLLVVAHLLSYMSARAKPQTFA